MKDMKNSFDFITFANIIFKQIILSLIELSLCHSPKCKFEIHGSLVMIQYFTKMQRSGTIKCMRN